VLDARLRGDTIARYQAYATGRQWGILSINDVREKENMNPIPKGGDVYLEPLNMHPAGEPLPEPAPPAPPDKPDPPADEPELERIEPTRPSRMIGALRLVFTDSLDRMLRKEAKAVRKAAQNGEAFIASIDAFYAQHQAYLCSAVGAVQDAAAAILNRDEQWAHQRALDLAAEHVAKSLAALKAIPITDELPAQVEAELAVWEKVRSDAEAISWLGRLAQESRVTSLAGAPNA
ncbi:MAG TPA: hypothetical protein VM223_21125, partial [Planctomycetota bacterium]|nr:hypothetical protein [Planctomycetota bacterium]